ncbi:MAG: hypothetical protein HYT21_03110 [Candidatus Nealsonbacteria bacterium]|nr:hypothetical protein [Candidatus Nealsonbacteria bacterium]
MRILPILKKHKWPILIAVLAAMIVAYPQAYFRYDQPDAYRGIEFIGASDDESPWLSRAREAQDGYLTFSCVYLKDGKDAPYLFQPLGTVMFAQAGKFFASDFNNSILTARFFFSLLAFLAIYAFLYLFLKSRLIALAITSFFILAGTLFTRSGIFSLLRGQSPTHNFLDLTRPVNPSLTFLFFFAFLSLFWLFIEKKQWKYGILSALALGLSFYDYFFTWTFIFAFCGALGLIFLIQKRFQDIKRIMLVIGLSLIMAIPYFINMYQTVNYPMYFEVGQRMGLLASRAPVLGLVVPLLFVAVLLFFPRKPRDRYLFALALVIAPFIVLNQQLITGKVLGYAHYHWYYHKPLAIILLLAILFFWLAKIKRPLFNKALPVLMIAGSLAMGIFIQQSSYEFNKAEIIDKQKYGPVMDWLNENAEKDAVVFSNNKTAHMVVIFTPLNVFYHSSSRYCLVSTKERLLNNLFLYYRLDGVAAEEAQELFLKDKRQISAIIFSMFYRETTGDYSGVPDDIIIGFSEKYKETLTMPAEEFLNNLWTKYEVEYLIWNKSENPKWNLDQYKFLKRVAEFGDFVVYEKE